MNPYRQIDRVFAPVSSDEDITPELIQAWGRQVTGAMGWAELLQLWRIVVLAEADSGKTREFEEQVKRRREDGDFAFFGRIELIADNGLVDLLSRDDTERFTAWLASTETAWFFLDSVDEAKLTRKSLPLALTRFARDLGPAYDRARVVISCRGSDWDGADLAHFEAELPAPLPAEDVGREDDEDALFAVLPSETSNTVNQTPRAAVRPRPEIVRLVDLTAEQRRAFVVAEGVTDPEAFDAAIARQGLRDLAGRPGDLRRLVLYWRTQGRFGSLTDMMEFSVTARLGERNGRPDASLLTDDQARLGAERIAAAMTLCSVLTVRSGDAEDADAQGLDPALVLGDWTLEMRGALLRRAAFAITTFGVVRFHHRSTQEFLCGAWFGRLLGRPGAETAVRRILFAEQYGVRTVPPSLRPAAAWLSQYSPGLAGALIACEPLILLTGGDPAALSLTARAELLQVYGRRETAGDLSDHFIEPAPLWMFADKNLAPTIRSVWPMAISETGKSFLLDLIRIVEEGRIHACLDLVEAIALDASADRYVRITAARALEACQDGPRLRRLADDLLRYADALTADLAPSMALACFPLALTVAELLRIIDESVPAREYQVEGFGHILEALWDQAADEDTREALIAGIAAVCRRPPLQEYHRLSERHRVLANHVHGLARRAVIASDDGGVTPGLISLLQVAERARDESYRSEDEPGLFRLVQARPNVKTALFWADVEEDRGAADEGEVIVHYWQIWRLGGRLAQPVEADIPAFEARLFEGLIVDRRMALSVLWQLARHDPEHAETNLDRLAGLVADQEVLAADLIQHRTPRVKSASETRFEAEDEQRKRRNEKRQSRDRETLIERRRALQADPGLLSDPERIRNWPGALALDQLTEWLAKVKKADRNKVALLWRDLEPAFGKTVAQAYRDGMKAIWRVTTPERPVWTGGTRTVKRTTLLAVAGLGLDAAEDSEWARRLTPEEVLRATRHGVWADQSYPAFLSDLLAAHPAASAPPVLEALDREWKHQGDGYTPFLYAAEAGNIPMSPQVRVAVLAHIMGPENAKVDRTYAGRQMLRRITDLTEVERRAYVGLVRRRLKAARRKGDSDRIIGFLGALLEFDARVGTPALEAYLSETAAIAGEAEKVWARLFGRSQGVVASIWPNEVALLRRLTELAYIYVHPDKDQWIDGEMTRRDDAQTARNAVLSALMEHRDLAAFEAVSGLAEGARSHHRATRFRQLAKRMAERDSEREPWKEAHVRAFEADLTAPAQSGEDLLRLILGLLDDIALRFTEQDVSSAAVLRTAADEKAVQQWLAAELHNLAAGRFRVHLEKQIVNDDRPDITISSATAGVEVAIEVKHADKSWTIRRLEAALSHQLAEQYLKPDYRRYGVLVISGHSPRKWIDTKTRCRLTFAEVIARLRDQATLIHKNASGAISVDVRGIDAWSSATNADASPTSAPPAGKGKRVSRLRKPGSSVSATRRPRLRAGDGPG